MPESEEMAAGGTIQRAEHLAQPAAGRRIQLLIEIGVFFLVAPILITYAVYGLRLPLFLVLQPVLLAFIVYLLWDGTFLLRRELARGFPIGELFSMLAMFLIVGGALTAFVAQEMPRSFLSFPRYRTGVWATVMILYPVLSVVAQELVYRTFFFHRYGPLFGRHRWLAIIVNGALFGFAHIIFYNPVALAGTFVAGCLFAYRYERTRSFWAVWLEHTLYGCLIFTIGLGGFFFTGIANPGWRW